MFHSSPLFSPAQMGATGWETDPWQAPSSEAQPPFRRAPPSPDGLQRSLSKDAGLLAAQKRGAGGASSPPPASKARGLGHPSGHSFGNFPWGSFGAGRWHLARVKAGMEKTKREPWEQRGQPCRAAQPRGGMSLCPPPPPRGRSSVNRHLCSPGKALSVEEQIWRRAPLGFSSGTVPASPPRWTGHLKSNSACCCCPGCSFAIKGSLGRERKAVFAKNK